ncbi:MAG TPA: hypothetical protein VFG64_09875 [Dongiaceae bacterium]|nr:hypothetical protein [Dongiaceae bacterium]
MNRSSRGRARDRLSILSAALLSAAGLMCPDAFAQVAPDVVVNYDALDSLSAPTAPGGVPNPAPAQPQSQLVPGYAPAYPPPPYGAYGTAPLAPPPPGALSSVLTTLGPDGRPLAPVRLQRPGSRAEPAQSESAGPADAEVVAATPPPEPAALPETVPMPDATPPPPIASPEAPAPAVEAPAPPATVADAPVPPATVAEAPAAAEPQPAPQQPAPEPAPQQQASEEQPAAAPASQPAAQQEAAKAPETPPEAGAAPEGAPQDQPAAKAAEAPAPDNAQPAPPVPEGGIRIVYPVDLNDVPAEADAALDDLASQMQADEAMRIQIKCYASGTEDTESKARRKSLARCIGIRQYLFKKDIRTTRMDVRALGLKSEGQPADRVDIVPANS